MPGNPYWPRVKNRDSGDIPVVLMAGFLGGSCL